MTPSQTDTVITKHTPGPWETEDATLSICRLIVSVEDVKAIEVHPATNTNHVVAYVPSDSHEAKQRANARLIAAAPELLLALQLILIEPHGCPMCDSGKLRNPDKKHWYECGFLRARAAIAKAEGLEP